MPDAAMLGGLALLSFLGTFVAVRLLLLPFAQFALDEPNARSLHERPVPRTGGIAVLLGGAISLGFGAAQLWLPMIIALCLAVVSFLDDLRGMPTGVRLLSHFAAAALLVCYTLAPMHPAELAVLIVAVVWITNLYNFMDGSDGLAGGMAVIGLGAYGVAAYAAGNMPLVALSLALAAASAAFLIHNFHPARIFLGDVGSIPLGFLAAALGIVGWRDDSWPLWFPVLVFGPFIGDATITLVKRLLRGERVWQPHREHYYQRMVRMGLGHRGTAFVAYSVMVACGVAALFGRSQAGAVQAAVFLGAAVALALMAVWVDIRWARFTRAAELSS
jgi:UDP-N-acetylmuramyl pentapeptide phosphotransferase/UDP-N-acetylglucosamine-1-phosphate transferase